MRHHRRLPALLSCAALATVVSGCGGAGGMPTNASVKDFCKAGRTFATANRFDAGVEAAGRLHDTGTPQDIPSDARAGFELVVTLIGDARDQADLSRRYQQLTAEEKKSVEALDGYIAKTC